MIIQVIKMNYLDSDFFFRNYLEEHKDSENENKIIGDNDIHMNNNNDNE